MYSSSTTTSGSWTIFEGSNQTVDVGNAWYVVVGADDTIDFSGIGGVARIDGTDGVPDMVNGASGRVTLVDSLATINGGEHRVIFAGKAPDAVSLESGADAVVGVGGTINLDGALARVVGADNTLNFAGNDGVNLIGGSDTLAFGHGEFGLDVVKHFSSSDTLQFSTSDFADFNALSSRLTQVGANAVITLDSTQAVTLLHVNASSLTAAQFSFV